MVTLKREARILQALKELNLLLEMCGENHWKNQIAAAQNGPVSKMSKGIVHWYGGMGSFSDLWLSDLNGHNVTEADEDKINQKLSKLRSKLYELVIS